MGERASPLCRWPTAPGSYPLGPWCAFQGQCTKHVVGWPVGDTMPEELVTTALLRALLAQDPAPSLVVHSDRGGQYCGNTYRALLHEHGTLRFQNRRGDCYNNAQTKSRWSRLKTEVLELREWPVLPTWPTHRPASLLQSRAFALQYRLSNPVLHSPSTSSNYCPKLPSLIGLSYCGPRRRSRPQLSR